MTVSSWGDTMFKMVPAQQAKGAYGIAYRLAPTGELQELWRTDGWYSFEVYLANDGHHLVRMGPWNEGAGPQPGDLAVAFYHDGRLLKQYSTAELVKDKSKVVMSTSHYQWLASGDAPLFRFQETKPHLGWKDEFTLTTIDDIVYRFNIATGAIVEARPPRDANTGWPTLADIDRLCIAVPLVECPFPYAKLDELVGLPRGSRFRSGTLSGNTTWPQIALSDPNNPKGFYCLAMEVHSADPIYFDRNHSPADVTSLRLNYVTAEGHAFEFSPGRSLQFTLERLRVEMRAGKVTPRELSERTQKGLNGRLIFDR